MNKQHEIRTKMLPSYCINSDFDIEIERKIKSKKYKVRYWSYILAFEQENVCYFAKIPKQIASSSDIHSDVLDERNRLIAISEVSYLLELKKIYNRQSSKLQVVDLVGYSPKMNAIITRKFEGVALYDASRNNSSNDIKNYYSTAANWLKFFHLAKVPMDSDTQSFLIADEKTIKDLIEWLSMYSVETYLKLESKSFIDKFIQKEQQRANYYGYTLGGFEVRNFLLNKDGTICFLDPTGISLGSKLDDVARFIVSIDMIPWGHIDAYIEKDYNLFKKVFLKSYLGDEYEGKGNLLIYYVIKWLLFRWREVSLLLIELKMNRYMRRIIKKSYSDYLFKGWVDKYLELL